MTESITFVVHPETEETSLDLFVKSIEDVQRLIKEVDYAVTRERPRRKWIIAELHSSAPSVTISPLVDGKTLDVVAKGLRLLTAEKPSEPPPHFTTEVLKDLKRMRRLFRGKDKARCLTFHVNGNEVAQLDSGIGEKVDRILRSTYDIAGSLEGTLEAVNLHGGAVAHFTIWERLSGHPVRCEFSKKQWAARVKALLEQSVLVSGQVRYFANGNPASIRSIRDIIDRAETTSSNESDFGSVPDLTAGLDPQAYLERIRQ